MAAFMNNRSISLMAGDGPHNNIHSGTLMNAITDARTPGRAANGASADKSPLQMFVKAKRKINDIYVEIEEYVRDVVEYMASLEADEQIVDKHNVQEVCAYVAKVKGIRDVLLRDHMKVAFFGRTSNGKSTVINAMLRDKILPSGIGHTTNCFLQVEGSDSHEAYLVTEASPEERLPVRSVGQLAHALCKEKLSESQLVRIYWPRDKCLLLRDDVVFVDSPGVDVTPNLDEWIDKHCLDADVFVLVANAESTLMVTEKNFFHKVSAKLSKPNIFILNNRWDASASEPEYLDQVRRQHQERALDFLVRELQVCDPSEAEERIFFISAKEVLQARLQEQGTVPQSPGASAPQLAEGFQTRYFEFQDFERKFEECISKSAVRTKFEQHAWRGRAIAGALRSSLDTVLDEAGKARAHKLEEKQQLKETLEQTERGLSAATHDTKEMIGRMVEDVEQRVSRALNEEIRRLGVLVDEFSVPFHPEPLVLNVYKRELHSHVEQGLGSNLRARLSAALATNVEHGQSEMMGRMERLLPEARRPISGALVSVRGRQPFELLYRLNCDNLCADFHEELEFRFTWGITALIQRYCSAGKANRLALKNGRCGGDGEQSVVDRPLSEPSTSHTDSAIVYTSGSNALASGLDEWSILSRVAVLSAGGTQGTFGGLVVGGFLIKTVGWRLILLTGAIYGCLYMYERLTWTNKAKERQFKRQYVEHATRKLRLIVDLTSANCSHQVQQELSGSFARLCHAVDEATADMSDKLRTLERDIGQLEEASATARVLRNKASYLTHELDLFEDAYLRGHTDTQLAAT